MTEIINKNGHNLTKCFNKLVDELEEFIDIVSDFTLDRQSVSLTPSWDPECVVSTLDISFVLKIKHCRHREPIESWDEILTEAECGVLKTQLYSWCALRNLCKSHRGIRVDVSLYRRFFDMLETEQAIPLYNLKYRLKTYSRKAVQRQASDLVDILSDSKE